jgi:hypothetical protein
MTLQLTREQMEAHLTLQGWRPIMVAKGGAEMYEGVIYVFDRAGPYSGEYRVAIAKQTLAGLNITVKRPHTDDWYMSDKYFWPLAHACNEAVTAAKESNG